MLDLSDFLLIRGTNYMRYTHSSFPYVELSQLKRLADALSLIIIPVDYSNFINVVMNNIDSNKGNSKKVSEESEYWSKIYTLYNKFIKKIDRQAAYILAPVNYYNLYYEAVSKEVMSKYFPKCFSELHLMLELLLPSQKITLQMIRQLIYIQASQIKDSERTANNIEQMTAYINEMNKEYMSRIQNPQYPQKKYTEQEVYNYLATFPGFIGKVKDIDIPCSFPGFTFDGIDHEYIGKKNKNSCEGKDPLIFSIERDVDVSSKSSDGVKANLGFVFGPKMPDEFFTEKGLTKTLHRTLMHKEITHTFIPKD